MLQCSNRMFQGVAATHRFLVLKLRTFPLKKLRLLHAAVFKPHVPEGVAATHLFLALNLRKFQLRKLSLPQLLVTRSAQTDTQTHTHEAVFRVPADNEVFPRIDVGMYKSG
jgi:hypothetical protein